MQGLLKHTCQLFYRVGLLLTISPMLAADITTTVSKPDNLLIRNVYVISAEAEVSASTLNVLIKDGRIRAIGDEEYPADKVLQGQQQYLIPGLIDSHVHLEGVPGLIPKNGTESALYQQALAQIPRSYLYYGFTTLLDLASTRGLVDRWNGQSLAPHAQFCFPVLIPGGYPVALMSEDIKPLASQHLLHDHHSHQNSGPSGNFSPSELIENAKEQNADCVKVFYETGFGSMRDFPVPSQAIIREVVDAAQGQSLPVFFHGNSASAYEFGLKAGVDMIVHGLWHTENLTDTQRGELAQRIANTGIAVQPTIQVLVGEKELLNPEFFNQPDSQAAIPPALLAWYQTDAGQGMANTVGKSISSPKRASAAERYAHANKVYEPIIDNVVEFSRQFQMHEGHLVFGSDTPSGPIYTQFPGLNGHLEIKRWHEVGIALPEIFRALTINNARVVGWENEIGSVEPGKIANLLLLQSNPLTDISAYDSISWVVLNGELIARDSLASK